MNGCGERDERGYGAVLFCGEGAARRYVVVTEASGHCSLVKGRVEKEDRSARDTALREIDEEIGLRDVVFLEGFEEFVAFPLGNGAVKRVGFFLARCGGGALRHRAGELLTARYLPYDEALAALHFSMRPVLARAEVFLNARG